MKYCFKYIAVAFLPALILLAACHKDYRLPGDSQSDDTVNTGTYVYNTVTKKFTPDDISVSIASGAGVKFVYSYLQRGGTPDTLVKVFYYDTAKVDRSNVQLVLPATIFSKINMTEVSGIKLMIKHIDNSYDEQIIPLSSFTPLPPTLKSFPDSVTPDQSSQAHITGQVHDDGGIKKVDIYDDATGSFELIKSITDINNAKDYNVDYMYTYRPFAKNLKITATDIFDLATSATIVINAFTPPMPTLSGFPASLKPGDGGKVQVTGQAHAESGIKKVDIYDDVNGSYSIIQSFTDLDNVKDYNVNYTYDYRANSRNIKVTVTDNLDLTASDTIALAVLPYDIYKDITLNAQGLTTNNAFIAETNELIGSCDLPSNEASMDFLLYYASAGPTLYSPANTTNIAKNYKCDGTPWTIANPSALKATKFRILVPGANNATDNLYANFNANNIPDLNDDGFFNGITLPSGSTARASATAGEFNTTDTYLIWVRIPKAGGAFRNCLLRAKEINSAASSTTIKFDIYVQK